MTFNDSLTSAKNPSISNQSSNKTFSKGEKFVHPCFWSCRDLHSPSSSLDDEAFITGSLENPKVLQEMRTMRVEFKIIVHRLQIPDIGTHRLEERINKNKEQIQLLTTSMKQVVSLLNSMVLEIDRLKKNSTQKVNIVRREVFIYLIKRSRDRVTDIVGLI